MTTKEVQALNKNDKSCKNQCKNNWCCRVNINYLPISVPADEIQDCIQLFLWRKCKVYQVDVPRFRGYIAIQETPCIKLGGGKCKAQYSKPDYCKTFPNMQSFTVLPKKCPFSREADVTLEFLTQIKQDDLDAGKNNK